MSTLVSKKVVYERLSNGADLYLLKNKFKDVVICKMAFPGGTYTTQQRKTIAALLGKLLPAGTKKKKRSIVHETLESMGADVTVSVDTEHLLVTIASRKAVFEKSLLLVLETLTLPVFDQASFKEARLGVENALHQVQEDTHLQAQIALMRSLFRKGHPHWVQKPHDALTELVGVKVGEVADFHRETFSSVGAIVCVVGDISPNLLLPKLETALNTLPSKKPSLISDVHVNRTHAPKEKDTLISIRDRMNVDMLLAIPLSVTRNDEDFLALSVVTQILGGSNTARLFNTLRTKKSLTYGSYASLAGFNDGYPGYLLARAIFPTDVFSRGREVMRGVVSEFVTNGVSAKELTARKEEISGKYKVGLSTTAGLCRALFATVLSEKPTSFVDEYPTLVQEVSIREANSAIHTHISYNTAVTASAGAVDKFGKPLV